MIIYYAHGGSDNHGCEAIIRGTRENLKTESVVFSGNQKADEYYGLNTICKIKPDTYKRYYYPIKWFFYKFLNKFLNYNTVFMLIDGKEQGVYLSVGGDNYCYPGLIEPVLTANKRIRAQGNKTVLWGTSIEPAVLENKKILEDISKYDLIFARESLTYNALLSAGIDPNGIFLYPDPAFAMPVTKCEVSTEIFEKPVVGINISPLIMKYENSHNTIMNGYKAIVSYIIDNTECNIALIPHVVKRNNNDFDAINRLKKDFSDKRIFVVEDYSADKIKYYISKCIFFVGARTHSTIAAYSTCVPTLVIGYSIKARGIANDIFGSEEGYVVDVRSLEDESEMLYAFTELFHKKDKIKSHLESIIPSYIDKTVEAVNLLNTYIDKWLK